MTAAPWTDPPARQKTLRQRRAERQGRRAEYWGRKLADAAQAGPASVAAVTFDRARSTLSGLAEPRRTTALQALADAIDRVRESHAE